MDIDFVITWVNSSDLNWLMRYNRYATTPANPVRFRDSGLLRYMFRMIEKNAPWVHRIFFVTDHQQPSWLNPNANKLQLVNHEDFLPEDALPVFNSNAIEVGMHRIQGLSDCFVSFNDDIFLPNPVSPQDFYSIDNLPLDIGIFHPIAPDVRFNVIPFNDMVALNRHFTKGQILAGNRSKFFSPLYGKKALLSLGVSAWPHVLGFENHHGMIAYRKQTFKDVWDAECDWLTKTQHARFRTSDDLSVWLMRYWQLASGTFEPRDPREIVYCTYEDSSEELIRSSRNSRAKCICINDVPGVSSEDFYKKNQILASDFERRFPEKSSFEI